MPSNYTENYHLNQWVPEDRVLRTDFNADNKKIDDAIKAVDQRADGLAASKADVSALENLRQTVNNLSGTVKDHTSSMTKLGNCQIGLTTYTGTGDVEHTITLPANTQFAAIFGVEDLVSLFAARGVTQLITIGPGGNASLKAVWGATSLKLSYYAGAFSGASATCNFKNVTYHLLTLRSLS